MSTPLTEIKIAGDNLEIEISRYLRQGPGVSGEVRRPGARRGRRPRRRIVLGSLLWLLAALTQPVAASRTGGAVTAGGAVMTGSGAPPTPEPEPGGAPLLLGLPPLDHRVSYRERGHPPPGGPGRRAGARPSRAARHDGFTAAVTKGKGRAGRRGRCAGPGWLN